MNPYRNTRRNKRARVNLSTAETEPMIGEVYKLRDPKTVSGGLLLFKCNNLGTGKKGQLIVTLTNVQKTSKESVGLQYFKNKYLTSATVGV